MSRCPSDGESIPAPLYQFWIKGYYGDNPFHESVTASVGTSPNVRLIFNAACNDTNIYVNDNAARKKDDLLVNKKSGDSLFDLDTVYCHISKKEWNQTWDKVKGDGKWNSYNILTEPIKWIRYELTSLVTNSMRWWLQVDDPFSPGDYGPGSANDSRATYDAIATHTLFICAVIAVISLIVVGTRMALQRNALPAADAARSMFTLVVVSGSALVVIGLLLRAGDRFTRAFIIKGLNAPQSTIDAHCQAVKDRIALLPQNYENMNFFLFVLCALFIVAGSVMLYVFMLARVFVVTLLAGVLPLAAAGTATETGRSWFAKHVSYLMAFILVKPAAAIVLVTALRMSNLPEDGGTPAQQLGAAIMLFLGTVMLPAMVRLAFPFTAAAAQGDKGAQTLVAGGVALGAKTVQTGLRSLRR